MKSPTPNPIFRDVRLIRHDESFEVRISTFYAFEDENKLRRELMNRFKSDEALRLAKIHAKRERGDKDGS